jgi:hypothetical protein
MAAWFIFMSFSFYVNICNWCTELIKKYSDEKFSLLSLHIIILIGH